MSLFLGFTLKEPIQSRTDWILPIYFREVRGLWEWAFKAFIPLIKALKCQDQLRLHERIDGRNNCCNMVRLSQHDEGHMLEISWHMKGNCSWITLGQCGQIVVVEAKRRLWGRKAVQDNCSFRTGDSPYTVGVEIFVSKAGWDSAGGDEIATSITAQ